MSFRAQQRKWFLTHISEEFVKFVVEVLINVAEKNIEITESGSRFLKRYKKSFIEKILSPTASIEKRKNLLQKGKFLESFMQQLACPITRKLVNLKT